MSQLTKLFWVLLTSVVSFAPAATLGHPTRRISGRERPAFSEIGSRGWASRLRQRIVSQLAPLTEPDNITVEAMVLGLGEMRSNPVLHAIWDSSSLDALVAEVFTEPGGIAWAREAFGLIRVAGRRS